MSISDELMWRYYELLSFKSLENIAKLKQDVAAGANPRDIKIELAKELIERFHSKEDAESAHQDFIQRFQKNQIPDDINVVELNQELPIANLLKEAGLVASTSEANRMIQQGAVKIDGEKLSDAKIIFAKGTNNVSK